MSRLVDFVLNSGETRRSEFPPIFGERYSGAGALDRERDDIYIAVRNMQDRLTEIEQDIGRFEQRIADRSSQ